MWLTSGYYARDVVLWEDHIIHDGERQWAIDVHRYTEGRIAYKFGGKSNSYGRNIFCRCNQPKSPFYGVFA